MIIHTLTCLHPCKHRNMSPHTQETENPTKPCNTITLISTGRCFFYALRLDVLACGQPTLTCRMTVRLASSSTTTPCLHRSPQTTSFYIQEPVKTSYSIHSKHSAEEAQANVNRPYALCSNIPSSHFAISQIFFEFIHKPGSPKLLFPHH